MKNVSKIVLLISAVLMFEKTAHSQNQNDQNPQAKVVKTDAEWKKILSEDAYIITRQAGTEKPYTGKYWNNHDKGVYSCICCGLNLFGSVTKFDSGTGWPSFYAPIKKGVTVDKIDNSLGIERTEVLCSRCGAHLGHVFDDGPKPTGLRYCMNSGALNFIKQ